MPWRTERVGSYFQEHPEKERSLAQPLLLTPTASAEINDPEWWSSSCMPEAFPLAFVVYFAEKKKGGVGGVRLMPWVWVISHSNHQHLQWQDLSAYIIVHCSNSLPLKFSACIMFLKIYHGNIKDLMQCFVQPLEFEVNWTSSMLYPGCWL